MHSNQSWPPVISPLGVHKCFRNATRAKQGCCRGWQGHTDFLSNGGIKIMVSCFGWFEVEGLEGLWDGRR